VIAHPTEYNTLSFNEQGHIIDAEIALSLPLIDFNAAEWSKKLVDSARTPTDEGRRKPLFAIVRGSGSGKTRALTEIRKEMCLKWSKDDVFVLAITFNSTWEVSKYYDVWNGVESPYVSYALSVVSRMACMFFNLKLSNVCNMMKNPASGLLHLIREMDGNGEEIIRQCIVWMVETVRSSHWSRRVVNTFVLLVDEVVQLEEHIKALYPVPKGTGLVVDSTAVLRAALLERGSFESVRLNYRLPFRACWPLR